MPEGDGASCDDEASASEPPFQLTFHTRRFALKAAVIASTGGLLFGYDIGVAAGALPLMKDEGWSSFECDMVVAILVAGGVLGAALGGIVTDRLGRWIAIMVTCALFIAGAFILGFAGSSRAAVYSGRLVVGIGVSMSAVADVAYLNEVAPPSIRGAVVGANELAISIGVLLAYCIGFGLKDTDGGWHLMFGLSGALAAVQAVGMTTMPESPRWLAARGCEDQTAAVLSIIYDRPADAAAEMQHIKRAVAAASCRSGGDGAGRDGGDDDAGSGGGGGRTAAAVTLVTGWRPQLALAVMLMVVQQVSANANLLNFAPEILEVAGEESRDVRYAATVSLGVVKVLMTLVAISRVDELGRRPLLLLGSAVITVSLLVLGASLSAGSGSGSGGGAGEAAAEASAVGAAFAFAACTAIVAAYAASFGPVTWLVVSEVFPDALRGRAMGVALVANWLAQLAVSGGFLGLLHRLGGGAFYVFALLSAVGFVLLHRCVPETRAQDPDEIAIDLRRRCAPCRRCCGCCGDGGFSWWQWCPKGDWAELEPDVPDLRSGSVQFVVRRDSGTCEGAESDYGVHHVAVRDGTSHSGDYGSCSSISCGSYNGSGSRSGSGGEGVGGAVCSDGADDRRAVDQNGSRAERGTSPPPQR